jgi:hypothetical protein
MCACVRARVRASIAPTTSQLASTCPAPSTAQSEYAVIGLVYTHCTRFTPAPVRLLEQYERRRVCVGGTTRCSGFDARPFL